MIKQSPSNGCLPKTHLPSGFSDAHGVIWYGLPVWAVGVSLPSCAPSQSLAHLQHAHWWGRARQRSLLQHCASPAQQQQNLRVITAFMVTNPKHRTTRAAVKKVNSTPARFRRAVIPEK